MSDSDSDEGNEPEAEVPLGPHTSPPLNQCEVTCGPYTFSSKFDSGNMAKAEVDEDDDTEFNIWTNPDCAGKEYETTCEKIGAGGRGKARPAIRAVVVHLQRA